MVQLIYPERLVCYEEDHSAEGLGPRHKAHLTVRRLADFFLALQQLS